MYLSNLFCAVLACSSCCSILHCPVLFEQGHRFLCNLRCSCDCALGLVRSTQFLVFEHLAGRGSATNSMQVYHWRCCGGDGCPRACPSSSQGKICFRGRARESCSDSVSFGESALQFYEYLLFFYGGRCGVSKLHGRFYHSAGVGAGASLGSR